MTKDDNRRNCHVDKDPPPLLSSSQEEEGRMMSNKGPPFNCEKRREKEREISSCY